MAGRQRAVRVEPRDNRHQVGGVAIGVSAAGGGDIAAGARLRIYSVLL